MMEKLLALRLEKSSSGLFAEATTSSTMDKTVQTVFQYELLSTEAKKKIAECPGTANQTGRRYAKNIFHQDSNQRK